MTDFTKRFYLTLLLKGQFNYCPLIWMLSNKAENHKINRLNERGSRALLNDEILTFNDMLSKSNNVNKNSKIDD